MGSVLSLNRFIIFRLCPTSSCASSCNTGYGEYMVDMDEYLMATTEYRLEQQEEVCENVYMAAAKCEKSHSFDNGYSNYNGYSNQMANEEVVCDFIDSIADGTYDQYGSIVVGGADSSTSSSSSTTGGQKFALTFFILGTVGLAVYAAMLHTNLTKSAKADLSSQGGAMA